MDGASRAGIFDGVYMAEEDGLAGRSAGRSNPLTHHIAQKSVKTVSSDMLISV